MPAGHILFGIVLAVVLVGVAVYAGWCQLLVFRQARQTLDSTEADFLRAMGRRRFFCSAIMLILGLMLAGEVIFLGKRSHALAEEGPGALNDPEKREFARFYGWYWLSFMVQFFVLLMIAGYDFWMVRRHGMREMRRLQEDRRAMIQREAARLRENRRDPPP